MILGGGRFQAWLGEWSPSLHHLLGALEAPAGGTLIRVGERTTLNLADGLEAAMRDLAEEVDRAEAAVQAGGDRRASIGNVRGLLLSLVCLGMFLERTGQARLALPEPHASHQPKVNP